MALEFRLNPLAPAVTDTDCIVVGVFGDGSLSPAGQAIDQASGGRLAALVARGDVSGKTGRTSLLPDLTGVKAPRVLAVGLGDAAKFAVPQYLKAVADAVRALKAGPSASALLTLVELPVPGRDAGWNLRQAAIAADHAAYNYTATRSRKTAEAGLKTLLLPSGDGTAVHFERGVAIAAGCLSLMQMWRGAPSLGLLDFQVALGLMGAITLVSSLSFLTLQRSAGAEVSGHARPRAA